MRVEQTDIAGLALLVSDVSTDARGGFRRTFCRESLAAAGIDFAVAQASQASNAAAGTLRGLHFQREPHAEAKLLWCAHGRAWDVVADVRAGSPTFGRWRSFDLAGDDGQALYLAPGLAHGYLTRVADTTFAYLMDVPYRADAAGGVRWNAPTLSIAWPGMPRVIDARGQDLPELNDSGRSLG